MESPVNRKLLNPLNVMENGEMHKK